MDEGDRSAELDAELAEITAATQKFEAEWKAHKERQEPDAKERKALRDKEANQALARAIFWFILALGGCYFAFFTQTGAALLAPLNNIRLTRLDFWGAAICSLLLLIAYVISETKK